MCFAPNGIIATQKNNIINTLQLHFPGLFFYVINWFTGLPLQQ